MSFSEKTSSLSETSQLIRLEFLIGKKNMKLNYKEENYLFLTSKDSINDSFPLFIIKDCRHLKKINLYGSTEKKVSLLLRYTDESGRDTEQE